MIFRCLSCRLLRHAIVPGSHAADAIPQRCPPGLSLQLQDLLEGDTPHTEAFIDWRLLLMGCAAAVPVPTMNSFQPLLRTAPTHVGLHAECS